MTEYFTTLILLLNDYILLFLVVFLFDFFIRSYD